MFEPERCCFSSFEQADVLARFVSLAAGAVVAKAAVVTSWGPRCTRTPRVGTDARIGAVDVNRHEALRRSFLSVQYASGVLALFQSCRFVRLERCWFAMNWTQVRSPHDAWVPPRCPQEGWIHALGQLGCTPVHHLVDVSPVSSDPIRCAGIAHVSKVGVSPPPWTEETPWSAPSLGVPDLSLIHI